MSFSGKLLLGILLCGFPLQVSGWDWHTRVTLILKDQPLLAACHTIQGVGQDITAVGKGMERSTK